MQSEQGQGPGSEQSENNYTIIPFVITHPRTECTMSYYFQRVHYSAGPVQQCQNQAIFKIYTTPCGLTGSKPCTL